MITCLRNYLDPNYTNETYRKIIFLFSGGVIEILFKNRIQTNSFRNLPVNSMRILINPEFINGKENNKQNSYMNISDGKCVC